MEAGQKHQDELGLFGMRRTDKEKQDELEEIKQTLASSPMMNLPVRHKAVRELLASNISLLSVEPTEIEMQRALSALKEVLKRYDIEDLLEGKRPVKSVPAGDLALSILEEVASRPENLALLAVELQRAYERAPLAFMMAIIVPLLPRDTKTNVDNVFEVIIKPLQEKEEDDA